MHLRPALLALLLGSIAAPVTAGIVLESGAGRPVAVANFNTDMPTIVVVAPIGLATSQASYPLQRSIAWSIYQRRDARTGFPLVYSGAVGASMGAVSPRQTNLRAHLAKANAYRLGYMGK